jgi:hypothetical protein
LIGFPIIIVRIPSLRSGSTMKKFSRQNNFDILPKIVSSTSTGFKRSKTLFPEIYSFGLINFSWWVPTLDPVVPPSPPKSDLIFNHKNGRNSVGNPKNSHFPCRIRVSGVFWPFHGRKTLGNTKKHEKSSFAGEGASTTGAGDPAPVGPHHEKFI